jgi:Tfp pilus assembly protein PilN
MTLKLTRNQLAAFLKDHESIKQFETLFSLVAPLAPDLLSEINTEAQSANSRAVEALASLNRIANALELLSLSPPSSQLTDPDDEIPPATPASQLQDDLDPPVQVGTMGQQQADRVNITGGAVSANLTNNQTTLLSSSQSLTNGAAAAIATLLNSPVAGNPTKWVAINDNGTTRYIPTW